MHAVVDETTGCIYSYEVHPCTSYLHTSTSTHDQVIAVVVLQYWVIAVMMRTQVGCM